MSNFREASYLAWSPDSKTLGALRGPELGKRKLVLIDVATGTQSVVAQGLLRRQERALPDECGRQGSQAPDPHQGAVPAPGAVPDRVVG
jgi:hypothetical protein